MREPVRRVVGLLLAAAVLGAAAGCGGSGSGPGEPDTALASARKQLDETSGVELELKTDELPEGVDGLKEATGVGTHAPAFDGTVVLLVHGLSLRVPLVAVDGKVYAKLPFTLKYDEIDPAEYGAPDPAGLMDPDTGLSSWLTQARGVEQGKRGREGETVLTSYSGTLPGTVVAATIPSADDAATFEVTFRLTDDAQLRAVDVSGPFYGDGGDVDYAITLSGYGTDQDISPP
jgi:lipoprotein LprG